MTLTTNPLGIVEEMTSPGTEIDPIIIKLEQAVAGETRPNAIMATTAMAIWMQNPALTADQLHRAIKSVSQFICNTVEACDLENLPIPEDSRAN